MCRFRGRASVGSKNIKFVHKHNIAYGKSLLNMKICMCVHMLLNLSTSFPCWCYIMEKKCHLTENVTELP